MSETSRSSYYLSARFSTSFHIHDSFLQAMSGPQTYFLKIANDQITMLRSCLEEVGLVRPAIVSSLEDESSLVSLCSFSIPSSKHGQPPRILFIRAKLEDSCLAKRKEEEWLRKSMDRWNKNIDYSIPARARSTANNLLPDPS